MAALGILLVVACAGRTKTTTTPDESVEHHHHGPESPKVKADDLEREDDAE